MEKAAANQQNSKNVTIKIHKDYCNGSDKKLLEQLSALLQSVYMRRMEEAKKQM